MTDTFDKIRMSDSDRSAVTSLRLSLGDVIIPHEYDHDFNLLRWMQGYNYDLDVVVPNIKRHFKFRRIFDLDDRNATEAALKYPQFHNYFPAYHLGFSGIDNLFIAVEKAGMADVFGLLTSIQTFAAIKSRLHWCERNAREIVKREKETGQQGFMIYIVDLEGMKMDPSLLTVITGSYVTMLKHLEFNFPEFVAKVLIINAPSFMPYMWKLVKPFINVRTRAKIEILSSEDKWEQEVQKMFCPNLLPISWGGRVRKDPDLETFLCRLNWKVPTFIPPCNPSTEQFNVVSIKPGSQGTIYFQLIDSLKYLNIMRNATQTVFGFEIQYLPYKQSEIDCGCKIDAKTCRETEFQVWCPFAEYPGLYQPDKMELKVPGKGMYKIIVYNSSYWFSSLQFQYNISATDSNGNLLPIETSL